MPREPTPDLEPHHSLAANSCLWYRAALDERELSLFDRICTRGDGPGERLQWTSGLQDVLGPQSALTSLARRQLPCASPVRLLIFNKTQDMNWMVPWHQDRVIAVRERHDVEGFTNWSRKNGTWHVEPPLVFLKEMIFARVHLDDTDVDNGCHEIACGSHLRGRVSMEDAADVAQACPLEMCSAKRGDVLFASALALHRSKTSQSDAPRRTLRIDYSARILPKPLAWDFE